MFRKRHDDIKAAVEGRARTVRSTQRSSNTLSCCVNVRVNVGNKTRLVLVFSNKLCSKSVKTILDES
jgi:hypothetical protein